MKKETMDVLKQKLWMNLLILSYLALSYYLFKGWWYSSIGSVLIVSFSYLIWKKDFLIHAGLKWTFKTVIKSLILAIALTFISYLVMNLIADKNNIVIMISSWKSYYHDIFYVLNEEIVLGPIILFSLVNRYKAKPLWASILLALAFSLIHFIFYKWIFEVRGIIELPTLLCLFFVGVFRNNLILYTGHIAYSWAFHIGWIAVMLGSKHNYIDSEIELSELERFNLYLGSTEMLIVSFVLVALSLFVWYKYPTRVKIKS